MKKIYPRFGNVFFHFKSNTCSFLKFAGKNCKEENQHHQYPTTQRCWVPSLCLWQSSLHPLALLWSIISLLFSLEELLPPLKIEENLKNNKFFNTKKEILKTHRICNMRGWPETSFSGIALILQMGNQDSERLNAFPKVTWQSWSEQQPEVGWKPRFPWWKLQLCSLWFYFFSLESHT